MQKVEVHPAGVFACEDCGVDTFVRMVVASPEMVPEELRRETEADRLAASEAIGGEVGEVIGEWLMMPDRVVCGSCGAEFERDRGDDKTSSI